MFTNTQNRIGSSVYPTIGSSFSQSSEVLGFDVFDGPMAR